MAEACLKTGVRRLVYASSIHALAEPPHGEVVDESMPCDPDRITMAYSRSKARGTLEIMEVVAKGLDGVIMLPTGMIGPNDFKPSETGRLILDYMAGRIPARVGGGYDFVDVRDVAEGHILAAEKGRAGEKYILSGEWISLDDIMKEISMAANVSFPRYRVPVGLASAIAFALTSYLSLIHISIYVLSNDGIDQGVSFQKRQGFMSGIGLFPSHCRKQFKAFGVENPVSYTHLDVYKRQMAHGACASYLLDELYDNEISENGQLLRNIMYASDFLQNHIRHYYLFSMPDFVRMPERAPFQGQDVSDLRLNPRDNDKMCIRDS